MKTLFLTLLILTITGCGASRSQQTVSTEIVSDTPSDSEYRFDADSAYSYVAKQVAFGPRVPNSEAHRKAGDWMVSELRRHGAEVIEQYADLKAFDGTMIHARNIFGRINPEASNRILLLAHYDCRPWADQDPDPQKRHQPVDGANDGASGVGVILEVARQLKASGSKAGVDFLFVDAEDWGTDGDDESWAMGARYFAQNPPVEGYRPVKAILLDMVGGKDASFPREVFSMQYAPDLSMEFSQAANRAGVSSRFPDTPGGAITDDHLELLKVGIPAIDIIEFNPRSGFNPTWHTTSDNMDNISAETLGSVGKALISFISSN